MSYAGKQDLQIVHAFSSVELPEHIFSSGKIQELVARMADAKNATEGDGNRLARLRREKSNSNFVSNWWNDLDDKIQDASLDLSQSIGSLTQRSAELLAVNTAISKVLSDQQQVLLEQQSQLRQQATALAEQNKQIRAQQDELAQQQTAIHAANEGLLQAKGVSQEQALKLIGCVQRVEAAEAKMESANQVLLQGMESHLAQAAQTQLAKLRAEQLQSTKRTRYAIAAALSLSVLSIALQLAMHFGAR